MTDRYTKDFIEFWEKYPKRWNAESDRYYKVGKWQAMREWKKLSEQDKKVCLAAVRFMKVDRYVPDAFRWLKNRRFDDIELPKQKGS